MIKTVTKTFKVITNGERCHPDCEGLSMFEDYEGHCSVYRTWLWQHDMKSSGGEENQGRCSTCKEENKEN